LPFFTSNVAYAAFKAGEKPGKLYNGPPWKPALREIEGGR
jgi:hypothetical protein